MLRPDQERARSLGPGHRRRGRGSSVHSKTQAARKTVPQRTRSVVETLLTCRRRPIATLAIALLQLPSCTADSPLRVETGGDPDTSLLPLVDDLSVATSTESTLVVRWTQVDDGTGVPASYRLKYAVPPIEWNEARTACTLDGDVVGAELSCQVTGLAPATTYDVQLMSFRLVDGAWQDATYSNVATGRTDTIGALPPDPTTSGIWVDAAELARRPTSGPDWDRVVADAERDPGRADIADQDSRHDVFTLAAALVCVRTSDHCEKARQGVIDAIGTEVGGRWLAVGRNLGSYVIAADLLGLRADQDPASYGSQVEEWMRSWLTKSLRDNNSSTMRPFGPFHSAANAAAQEGFAYAAVAAYLGDDSALRRAWDAFRTFACDPGAPDRENIDLTRVVDDGWTDPSRPCAVNPAGSGSLVPPGVPGAGTLVPLDGALGGDMRRGGTLQWVPGYTQYPWVGLEGFVPAAVILERAGYPAFRIADDAVLRTLEYLWSLRAQTGDERWFDGSRAREIVHVVNVAYGASFPVNRVVGAGRTVGYTGWTHAR